MKLENKRSAQDVFNENWDRHEPFRYLNFKLGLVEKLTKDSDEEAKKWVVGGPATEWAIFYYNLAVASVISGFEFFLRKFVDKENDEGKFYFKKKKRYKSFQNYDNVNEFLKNKFEIDLDNELTPLEIDWLVLIFAIRHIITHNGEIIDEKFLEDIQRINTLSIPEYLEGHWFGCNHGHVNSAYTIVKKISGLIEKKISENEESPIDLLLRGEVE